MKYIVQVTRCEVFNIEVEAETRDEAIDEAEVVEVSHLLPSDTYYGDTLVFRVDDTGWEEVFE